MSKTLKSMTAYGRSSLDFEEGYFELEIIGTNRRHLEVNLSLPKDLYRFEPLIKKWISEKAARGQINLNLFWKKGNERFVSIYPDIALAKAIYQAADGLSKALNIPNDLRLFDLLQDKDILVYEKKTENEAVLEENLKRLIQIGFENFDQMKQKEGKNLLQDFESRLLLLKEKIEKIEYLSPSATVDYRNKLKERVGEFFSDVENDERILKEIALYADRIDITEEIVRFKSHLKQFNETLENQDIAKGKRIEFLLQELAREMNTIGSKTSQHEVSSIVVDCKCELEKMREQSQNIE